MKSIVGGRGGRGGRGGLEGQGAREPRSHWAFSTGRRNKPPNDVIHLFRYFYIN